VCRHAVDKDNLHRILLEMLQSRREKGLSTDCPVLDAALSLDISDTVMSADLVSILISALSTTVPCTYIMMSPCNCKTKFHYADFPVNSATEKFRGSWRNGIWTKGDVAGLSRTSRGSRHSGICTVLSTRCRCR